MVESTATPGSTSDDPRAEASTDASARKPKTVGMPEKQLTDIGRNNPSQLAAHELAVIEEWQAKRNTYLKVWREFDAKRFPSETRDLLFGKADRAIRNNMTPDDLSAVLRERRGEMILKSDGTPFNHILEYAQARNAVKRALRTIDARLEALGDVDTPETRALEAKRRDLSVLVDQYETASGGEP